MSEKNFDSKAPDFPAALLPEELIAKLDELAQQPAPEDLQPGAMCYSMAAPPDREEYICPACGERTLYATVGSCSKVCEVPAARDTARRLSRYGVSIDETSFCKHCSPETKGPQIALLVRYADGEQHRVEDVARADLQLVEDFFAGHGIHEGGMGRQWPLKNQLKRLAQLLLAPAVFVEFRRERSTMKKLSRAIKRTFGGGEQD